MTSRNESLFTANFCEALKKRRRDMGLSYAQLGFFLGVHWSTVRKWERGVVKTCNARTRPDLLAFIERRNEAALQKVLSHRRQQGRGLDCPQWAQACFARVRMIFEMCGPNPELQRRMIRTIDERIFRLIGDFAGQFGARRE